tara:strand:+ start:864 stop:1346 length:483 start_codon:yes stop_codon:yes gene_type:complete
MLDKLIKFIFSFDDNINEHIISDYIKRLDKNNDIELRKTRLTKKISRLIMQTILDINQKYPKWLIYAYINEHILNDYIYNALDKDELLVKKIEYLYKNKIKDNVYDLGKEYDGLSIFGYLVKAIFLGIVLPKISPIWNEKYFSEIHSLVLKMCIDFTEYN